jgi:hypothetical protein
VIDSHGREEIQRLRAEITQLKSELPLGDHWQVWYQRTCNALSRLYGLESAELQNFQRIRFEVGKVLETSEKAAELGIPLEASQIRHYIERLSEADEFRFLSHSSPSSACRNGRFSAFGPGTVPSMIPGLAQTTSRKCGDICPMPLPTMASQCSPVR